MIYAYLCIIITTNMKSLIAILISVITLTSCQVSKQAFTSEVKSELADTSLYEVQYFISGNVTLYKTTNQEHSAQVKSGVIYIKDKSSVENIYIRKGTPCQLVKQVNDSVARFAFDNSGRTLKFAQCYNGRYVLAGEWSDDGSVGKIKFGEQTYLTTNGYVYIQCVVVRKEVINNTYKFLPGKIVSK